MPEKPLPPHLRAKLDALGITDRDWARIREMVLQVTPASSPPALFDLDSTYAVAAVKPNPRYTATDYIGIVTRPDGMKVKLIYWKLSEHELYGRGKG